MGSDAPSRSGRFVIIPARAIDDQRLGSAALRVLCALGTYGDRDGRCFPKLTTIAQRLSVSKQAISKQIHVLETLGYLEILPQVRGDGSTGINAYRLIFDAQLAALYDRLRSGKAQTIEGQPYVDGVAVGESAARARESGQNASAMTGQPYVDGRQPGVGGPSTSEVDPIEERPIRTKDSRLVDSEPAKQFETFWRIFPKREGPNPKKPAREKFEAAVKRGIDPAVILWGAENYAAEMERTEKIGTRHVCQALTFLSQERWNDYQQPQQPEEAWPRAGMC